MKYIDLFAGAGGLSEGFIRSGFEPVAHVEMNKDACDTLRTRTAFHYLKGQNRIEVYYDYLKGNISRDKLWSAIPKNLIESVINIEISPETLPFIFEKIDNQLGNLLPEEREIQKECRMIPETTYINITLNS